jgi:hypothetical protein
MKRTDKTSKSNKKLVLNKQTIRELRPVELECPVGGLMMEDNTDTAPC